MSASDTRPPLFDPSPGPKQVPTKSTPAEGGAPFSRNPNPRSRGKRDQSGDGSNSPTWVRPFIFGGLILVAVISLVSIFGGGGEDESATTSGADLAVQQDVAADPEPDPVVAAEDPSGDAATAQTPSTDATTATAAVADDVTATAGGASPTTATTTALEAFAVEFAFDYLNFSADGADIREARLASYLAPGLDPQLGWDGEGAQAAVLTMPVSTSFTEDGATVVVASQITGAQASQWVHLAVPIGVDDAGRFAVTASPAYVSRPDAGDPAGSDPPVDDELSAELGDLAEPFFRAFASRDVVNETGITAVDADIRGLNGDVSLVSVGALRVLDGDDTTRDATINVTWQRDTAGSQITQTYVLTLTADGGDWLVQQINTG